MDAACGSSGAGGTALPAEEGWGGDALMGAGPNGGQRVKGLCWTFFVVPPRSLDAALRMRARIRFLGMGRWKWCGLPNSCFPELWNGLAIILALHEFAYGA
jgi:hypothetical protein